MTTDRFNRKPDTTREEPEESTAVVPPAFEHQAESLEGEERTEQMPPVFAAGPQPALQEPTALLPVVFPEPEERTRTVPPVFAGPSAERVEPEFGFSSDVVRQHFGQCRDALGEMRAWTRPLVTLAEGPQLRWRESASVLRLERVGVVHQQLLDLLGNRERGLLERMAAGLLLQGVDKESPNLLLERAVTADQAGDLDGVEAVIGAIELGDGTRRDRLLLRGHGQASSSARLRWLAAMERQAIDPGPELVGAALNSARPEERAAGLRLLSFHAERGAHCHTLLPHLFAREPVVRSAAVVAGLVLGLPEAPLLASQTARRPGMFAPTCLHVTEASAEQLDALLDLGGRDHAPPQLDLALALSGRPRAIAAVLARRGGTALSAELDVALRFVVGFDGPAEALPAWWDEHAAGFAGQDRLVRGQPATAANLVASLGHASSPVWQALRLELLVRSAGAIRLSARGLPGDLLAAAEAIDPGQLPGLSSD